MAVRLHPDRLRVCVTKIFAAAGCSAEEASTISAHLVLANLVGHDSHGVIRLREYLPWLEQGMVRANQRAEVAYETAVSLLVDGGLGFGQVIGEQAIELITAKASASGMALLGIHNTGHLGRIGHWAERCADAGFVSLHLVNTSGFGVLVAPVGGREARLSANPFAMGVPRGQAPALILDCSSASIAEGKIKVALDAGTELPEGAVVDSNGHPTRDPVVFYGPPRGAILPFGGHKGYALSVMIEAFAGALTGAGCSSPAPERRHQLVNNMCSILLHPDLLAAGATMPGEIADLEAWIKSATPTKPDGAILLPGELERRTRAERQTHGIPLDVVTLDEIARLASKLGVDHDLGQFETRAH